MTRWNDIEGSPDLPGATWIDDRQAWNFALHARHATGVTLLLFGANPAQPLAERRLDPLRHKSGRVWHCRVAAADVPGAEFYAYRVEGPDQPGEGHRFDPAKVLLDPYATAVHFPPGFSRSAASAPGANAGRAPLGVLPRAAVPFDWGDDPRPRHAHDLVVYEVHVRGFTRRQNSGVASGRRGTFAGLMDRIPYLQELGITAVELLPIHQFDPQERNYWGYMTLDFMAPHQAYAAGGRAAAMDELRALVKALHQAGIEVILDVVYNHTAEGGASGPVYSYRGIDNSTYYLLKDNRREYRDDTGTGNVLRTAHPAVRKLVLDSLRYWVREAHVDGFRFDLASIFMRRADGSLDVEDPPIIAEISGDPCFAGVRLIAEAWDPATYQLGRSFPGTSWLQWNDRFRDDVRSWVKSDPGTVPGLMARLYGSDDVFPDAPQEAYHAYQSVNFVTAHDGFCLYDLVSYNEKHNEANGESNRDGTSNNRSWNCGWEGDEGVPAVVLELRKRQVKNFCSLLFLANGTPMLCAGDEFMNTQRGNNNPYNQDNETTWLDWDRLARHQDVFRFFQQMMAFRKQHPSLGRSRFWRDDIRWYGTGPAVDMSQGSRTLAFCLRGASEGDCDIYAMISAYWEPLTFRIQEGSPQGWVRVIDTSLASPDDILEPGREAPVPSLDYIVGPRSVVVLTRV